MQYLSGMVNIDINLKINTKSMSYFESLKGKMDEYAHLIYKYSKKFPTSEKFGLQSQFRRASISVVLNFIEGYARQKPKVQLNFFEISYGSLKESKYLEKFCYDENLINKKEFEGLEKFSDEIGAMLWGILKKLNVSCSKLHD